MPSDTTSPLPALQYAVFLSYRHADNIDPGRQWASWLHVSLETYEVPPDLVGTPNALGEPIAASLYPVFRDEEELPAGADLTNEIRQALERSRTLVVLCSPRAVGSRFVADEIRYFKELGKSAHLLALMIDGEPNVTDDPGKHAAGIPASTECLPEPLRFGVPRDDGSVDWAARAQPVCADVRPEGRPVQGWTTAAACRESLEREGTHAPDAIAARVQDYERRLEIAKLKIVAGALGVPLGELTKRDAAFQLEKERRRRKITAFIASVVLVLGLLAVWQWRVAIDQRHEADIQKADAVDARGRAEALAKSEAQQRGLADEQRGLAEAQRIATETANATLKDQLHEASRSDHVAAETHFRDNRWHQGVAYLGRSVRYDPDNLASLNHLWTALLYGQGNREGRMVSAMPFPVERFVSVPPPRFFANGSRVLAANLKNDDVQRWTPDGTPIGKRISWKERALHAAALTTDEKTIVTLSGTKFDKPEIVERWDAETGEAAGSHVELPSPAQWKAGPLSPDGRFVALRFENQPKGKFVFKAGGFVEEAPPPLPQRVQIFDWERRNAVIDKTMAPNARADLQFIPSGQGVLIQVGYTVEVYALPSGARLGTVTTEHFSTALPSPDGSQLFIEQLVPGTNRSYDLTRWETKSGKLTGRVRFSDTAPAGILRGNNAIISPDGHWLLSFHPDPVTQFRLRATIHDLREMKKVAETPVFPIRLQDDGSAFSSDGRYFVTCTVLDSDADRAAKIPGSAQVWETATCKPVGDPLPHPNGVRTATFNESGRMVLTTGFDSTLRVWKIGRTRASAQILMHRPKEVNQKDSYAVAARWLAGGAKVATVAMGETDLRLWDPATGQATAHSSSVAWNSAFVSPSGK